MRETIELFGETLRYDAERSYNALLIWQGPTFRLSIYRFFDDAASMWSLGAEGADFICESYGNATVAEAAQHLATILMAEIEDRAQVARRLLAGINAELRGGEA